MTEDELQAALREYFSDWHPDMAEGWFQAGDMARLLEIPRNTAYERLQNGIKNGGVEMRKRGREKWYRLIPDDGAIGGGG